MLADWRYRAHSMNLMSRVFFAIFSLPILCYDRLVIRNNLLFHLPIRHLVHLFVPIMYLHSIVRIATLVDCWALWSINNSIRADNIDTVGKGSRIFILIKSRRPIISPRWRLLIPPLPICTVLLRRECPGRTYGAFVILLTLFLTVWLSEHSFTVRNSPLAGLLLPLCLISSIYRCETFLGKGRGASFLHICISDVFFHFVSFKIVNFHIYERRCQAWDSIKACRLLTNIWVYIISEPRPRVIHKHIGDSVLAISIFTSVMDATTVRIQLVKTVIERIESRGIH